MLNCLLDSFNGFDEYIHFLKENVENLIDFQSQTGTKDLSLLEIHKDLINRDPFIVLHASLAATLYLSNKSIYH